MARYGQAISGAGSHGAILDNIKYHEQYQISGIRQYIAESTDWPKR